MGNMEGGQKEKENYPWESGLLFLTKLGLGNTRSLIGHLLSPEDDSVLLAQEWVCISVYINLQTQTAGGLPLAQPAIYYHSQGGVRCSAFKGTGFSAVFLPLRVYIESSVLYINQSFHDLL